LVDEWWKRNRGDLEATKLRDHPGTYPRRAAAQDSQNRAGATHRRRRKRRRQGPEGGNRERKQASRAIKSQLILTGEEDKFPREVADPKKKARIPGGPIFQACSRKKKS